MSTLISVITSLLGAYPLAVAGAHPWYADHPTDSDPFFGPSGFFDGGDLPFGLVYEVHDIPATLGHDWTQTLVYDVPLVHISNNAQLHSGIGSAIPVEEFFLNHTRGLIRFHEPSTSSIDIETQFGCTVKLWGLYIDIPAVTPTQMTWNATTNTPTPNPPSVDGASFTGLTGHGSIAVTADIAGARVEITSTLDGKGEEDGEPVEVFDLGWVNWGDAAGSRSRERITSTAWETWLAPGDQASVLRYSLSQGTEATITLSSRTTGVFI